MRGLIASGQATAVHDLSDGGLLVALAEMAMASGIGAELEAPSGQLPHAFWFGEDQGRYVITVEAARMSQACWKRPLKAGFRRKGLAGLPGTH